MGIKDMIQKFTRRKEQEKAYVPNREYPDRTYDSYMRQRDRLMKIKEKENMKKEIDSLEKEIYGSPISGAKSQEKSILNDKNRLIDKIEKVEREEKEVNRGVDRIISDSSRRVKTSLASYPTRAQQHNILQRAKAGIKKEQVESIEQEMFRKKLSIPKGSRLEKSIKYSQLPREDRLVKKEMRNFERKARLKRLAKAEKESVVLQRKLSRILNRKTKEAPTINPYSRNAPQVGSILNAQGGFFSTDQRERSFRESGNILNTPSIVLSTKKEKKQQGDGFLGKYQF